MNNKQPDIIREHLLSHQIQQLEPAWVQLKSGTDIIQSIGGAWQHYFQSQVNVGDSLPSHCEVLFGMLPIIDAFELPQVQLVNDVYTDIYAMRQDNSEWVLFCDVTTQTLQMQAYQQASNELVLTKGKLDRILGRYVGHEVASRASQGSLAFDVDGERRLISTLFVDIRGFTPFNERHDAQVVMQTLNDYMDCMLPPILNQSGMIDKIMGDGAMAVFGVLKPDANSALHAFTAGKQILQSARTLNKHRMNAGLDQLGIGVGIATGEAVLGVLGSHDRRCFTAIGPHVNLAARLESNARVGEILLDQESHNRIDKITSTTMHLELKGLGQVTAYSHMIPSVIHK